MNLTAQHFSEAVIDEIQDLVSRDSSISRRALSLEICERNNWRSLNGKLKEMSCRKLLLEFDRKGLLNLPKVKIPVGLRQRDKRRKKKEEKPPETRSFSGSLKELGGIELVLISNRYHKNSKIWNSLMDNYHYLGKGPLCGSQLRYLIRSSNFGWLGGLSFSGAARRLEARDRFIGWNDEKREKNLFKVVCNSRFLILPKIKVPNLASYVLSQVAKTLREDWFREYNYYPALLESFVEVNRYRGTCYRASNWESVGFTKGRGRQDREKLKELSIKEIFLYPLGKEWRSALFGSSSFEVSDFNNKDRVSDRGWEYEEFGNCDLGDVRLKKRLLTIARDFYANPLSNIPEACGSVTKATGAYRFFSNPSTPMKKLLQPHYESTTERIKKHSVVLAVQDTTSLNYTSRLLMEGTGPIGTKRGNSFGLMVHDTLAFNVDGTPLGLLDVQCWKRDSENMDKKKLRHKLPINKKESFKWLKSYFAVGKIQEQCPETMLVSVGDRESDIYELFALESKKTSFPKLLVRAEHNRLLAENQGKLWEKVEGKKVCGVQEIQVPRKGNTASRVAKLSVRFSKVKLKAPKSGLAPVSVWAVLAKEVDTPAEIKPLEWMLLTTVEVSTFDHAVERLRWYALRWGIEVFHRTFKSGCKIEDRQLGNASSMKACFAIDMVVAWRVFHLIKLGRETPDLPCSQFFEEEEWKSLACYTTKNPIPPVNPPSLRAFTLMVATLGGFLGRKSDGNPGTQTLWRGLQRLDDIKEMWMVMSKTKSIPP